MSESSQEIVSVPKMKQSRAKPRRQREKSSWIPDTISIRSTKARSKKTRSLNMFTTIGKIAFTASSSTLLAIVTVLVVYNSQNELKAAMQLRGRRKASINLGGGKCQWTDPNRNVPDNVDFHKTLLAGFPSGDKRMAWIQMEALTGLPTQNDWDMYHNGYTNSPFIKTNYPHPSGTWSWGNEADQVALTVQYIRRSMVEYADIQSYIDSIASYNDKKANLESIYGSRSNLDAFYAWRDKHVLSEIFYYGWIIDFWMEAGQFRDPYSHAEVVESTWKLFSKPPKIDGENDKAKICHRTASKKNPWIELEVSKSAVAAHLEHGDYDGSCADAEAEEGANAWTSIEVNSTNTTVTHEAGAILTDPLCSKIGGSLGCQTSIIILSDKLRSYTEGPLETAKIASFLRSNYKIAPYVIEEEAWPCIWDQVIDKGMGPLSFQDRDISEDPSFSPLMLEEMINELTRMVTKYSQGKWKENENAQLLVSLFSEHLILLQTELDDVTSGRRRLGANVIYGPNERKDEKYHLK